MHIAETFALILPAAGTGTRFGGGDKLLSQLHGRTVLQRAVALFASRSDVTQIVIPTSPERFEAYQEHLATVVPAERLTLVAGGAQRWESVLNGLKAVRKEIGYVAIHDAARPLTPASVIDAAFRGAIATGGSVPAIAEPATLKRADAAGLVSETVDRRSLFQAQTPQCFRRELLLRAFAALEGKGELTNITDDAQIFERAGLPVVVTPGSPLNLKITTAEDLTLAAAILAGI